MNSRLILATALALAALFSPACKKHPPASQSAASSFTAHDRWLTDFAKAQALARTEQKMVLLDFTGSDWCPPCIALHKNVLSTQEFLDYAKDNLVLVLVDFPERKPQAEELKRTNKELSEQFAVEVFPTVIVLSSDGRQLSKDVGYAGTTAKAFVEKLKKLKP